MHMRHAAVVAGLALGMMSGAAKASYLFEATQINDGVSVTGSGDLDITGLRGPFAPGQSSGYIDSFSTQIGIGTSVSELFSGVSNSQGPFLDNGRQNFTFASSNVGNAVGLSTDLGYLVLPNNYQSGDPIGFSSSFFNNTTFDALGLRVGSFTLTLPHDTITFDVISPVPLPASAPMFGVALLALGAVGYGLKRRKAAAAA